MHWGWTQCCSRAPSLPGWMSLGFSFLLQCATQFFPFSPARLWFSFSSPLIFSSGVIWNVDGVRAETCFSSIGICFCLALLDLSALPAFLCAFGTGVSGVPHHPKDLFVFVYLHNEISEDFKAFPFESCLCGPIGIDWNMHGVTIPWIPTVFPGLGKSKLMTSFHILHSLKTGLLPFRLRPNGRGPTRDSYLVHHQPFKLLSPRSICFSELVQAEL